jgi:hypothetical protein
VRIRRPGQAGLAGLSGNKQRKLSHKGCSTRKATKATHGVRAYLTVR